MREQVLVFKLVKWWKAMRLGWANRKIPEKEWSNIDHLKTIFGGNLPEKENDVIIASGIQTAYNQWEGNIFFNNSIRRAVSDQTSPSHHERKKIISTIMDQIEKNDGRFVRYNHYGKKSSERCESTN
mmetsp:Transcript_54558/g.60970  ORF Transcript_54558/g.60970 Transcript_54558/m.60970 type:complete len:127 (+) Transcript_54558:59-439(+)